ncbi:MAG: DNA polymerase III subunit delta' [Polyangiaceae bacterium UTPRO1]|jgi:DNA polymerase-3 subunit delta'|nr:DNA polymerase III subunit delta' [Myxococcales bacterium]OQY69009.1 MAG: DNA polymerase III subunit delta' [Polyangiaceae bacterium UTPRO1]
MPPRRPASPPDRAPAAAAAVGRFADVRGHERAITHLRRGFEAGRLAHAFVFTGPEGVGKLTVARLLAAGLHCDVAPFDACGGCGACRTIAAGTHPDVRIVAGPLDGKRDISIEQVRDLQRELGFRSLSQHPKVGIIDDAHLLTAQAQNALLKTLEEPSGDSVLVLVAVQQSALLPTILSRCQRVSFGPLPTADVVAILERRGRSATEARALAAYADGSPGVALGLDPELFDRRRRELLTALAGLRGADFKKLVDFAQTLAGEDKDPAAVLALVASWHRDLLRRAVLGADAELQNADLAAAIGTPDVGRSLRNLETTYDTMRALRRNANRNLALVRMLMRFE